MTPQYKPGDRVRSLMTRRVGTVTGISAYVYSVKWDNWRMTSHAKDIEPYCDTCRNTGFVGPNVEFPEPCPEHEVAAKGETSDF